MNFSIAGTIRRLLAPRHRLSVSWFVWRRLGADLRARGRDKSRESGAFLLGRSEGNAARIVDYVLYDDLDPRCLDTGIVRFNGNYFGTLWDICARRGLSVVADVHVHPLGSGQSESDQNHPMISQAGHLALIIANFASQPVRIPETGIYRYLGGKRWESIPLGERAAFFHVGL